MEDYHVGKKELEQFAQRLRRREWSEGTVVKYCRDVTGFAAWLRKTHCIRRSFCKKVMLGFHSMCRGAESKFFNGHTNITSSRFLAFWVKRLLQASWNVKGTMLFNVLSYLSDKWTICSWRNPSLN